MTNILFLGPLYPWEREEAIREKARYRGSNAANVYQWNLLNGMFHWVGDKLSIINALPVGIWPGKYDSFILPDTTWDCNGILGREVGCVNLPFIKQQMRAIKVRKMLRDISSDTEVVIYSAYMPFLKAAYKLPKGIKVTAIITDLPEFYDSDNVSKVRSALRKLQNRMIYKYMNRVDRFVVLTKQMCEPLQVGERPWICLEGVCNVESPSMTLETNTTKSIMYSGGIHYQYGIKNLLDAFEQIEMDDVELWLCGAGDAVDEVQKRAETDPRIKFFGHCSIDRVAELRAQASILINPRTNEGEYTKYSFPSKTMEYMASGKPAIMHKLDGIPEEYDEYLFYAATEDADGLKNMILNVINNYEQATEKARLAQRFVIENKTGVAQAKKMLSWMAKEI